MNKKRKITKKEKRKLRLI